MGPVVDFCKLHPMVDKEQHAGKIPYPIMTDCDGFKKAVQFCAQQNSTDQAHLAAAQSKLLSLGFVHTAAAIGKMLEDYESGPYHGKDLGSGRSLQK